MALFPSLPAEATLADLFSRFPDKAGHLFQYIEAILRDEGELPVGEREMIAAYVSGLNACTFCYGSHRVYSEIFGIPRGMVDALLNDIETAPVRERMKPIFRYVQKLNTLPSKMVQADADAVFAAGWSEAVLFEVVQISGLFNLMNRIIEGTGVNFDFDQHQEARQEMRNRRRHSYLDFGRRLGVIPPEDDSLNV